MPATKIQEAMFRTGVFNVKESTAAPAMPTEHAIHTAGHTTTRATAAQERRFMVPPALLARAATSPGGIASSRTQALKPWVMPKGCRPFDGFIRRGAVG